MFLRVLNYLHKQFIKTLFYDKMNEGIIAVLITSANAMMETVYDGISDMRRYILKS